MGNASYEGLTKINAHGRTVFNGVVRAIDSEIDRPRSWSRPENIFACSMSDFLHTAVPLTFLQRIFKTIRETPRHKYLLLTKRPQRAARDWPSLTGGDHFSQIRFGITAENQRALDQRLGPFLRVGGCGAYFISAEPLLGPIRLPSSVLRMGERLQIVIGGESGRLARPTAVEWIDALVLQCLDHGVKVFFKQWGEYAPVAQFPRHTGIRITPEGSRQEMVKVGTKNAGRIYWGIEWDQEPIHN